MRRQRFNEKQGKKSIIFPCSAFGIFGTYLLISADIVEWFYVIISIILFQPPEHFTKKKLWGGQRAVILNVSGSLSNYSTEAYSVPCQTSIMEVFMKIVNGFRLLSIFAKIYILDT